MNNTISVIYTTVGSERDAEELANRAISEKLAACVNIFPGGKSFYYWEGRVESSHECYMIFKTTLEMTTELENLISELHPYDVPAILKFQPNASQLFFDYIHSGTQTK